MKNSDIRDDIKHFMGVGYITEKAKELRLHPDTLSRILAGRSNNQDVYDECLSELNKRIREKNEAVQEHRRQREMHRQLQGI